MSKVLIVIRYLAHAALSSYGVVVVCFFVEMILGSAVGPQNRFLDYFFYGPTFFIPVVTGLALGYLFGRNLPRWSARLLFAIPLVLALNEIWSDVRFGLPGASILANIRDNYLGTSCGATECLSESVFTAPLFSSVAYAVGSEISSIMRRRANKV